MKTPHPIPSEVAPATARRADPIDVPTLLAIACIAYAITNVLHEGVGHGGACLFLGGTPRALNAIYFQCDKAALSPAADKGIAAGGTIVNLLCGAVFAFAFRHAGRFRVQTRYLLWLLAVLSFLQATGYWLFSGVGNIGDWAHVIEGWRPHWLWRVFLTVGGGATYMLTVRLALRALSPLLGGGDAHTRLRTARTVTLLPYLAGGVMYVAAGLLNPVSPRLVLISAAAASFGGASALAWMTNLLRDEQRYPAPDAPAMGLGRSWPWIVAGAAIAGMFIVVLGRTVTW